MGDLISGFAQWLINLLLFIPRKTFELLCDGLGTVFQSIPAPDFLTNGASYASGLPAGIGYVADVFAVPQGFAILGAALLARFLLRRIPFIG